eukprot:TRINITY_DN2397_c0_g1_i2.p1 TRINITY_DN2397_c0_g1~~TRINITY_DN2397_c0_g1_i2.p1  ORF type:complete len:302 (-),score=34.61 TRINITY_DN2397_c0_g1_i2:105-1010(-)
MSNTILSKLGFIFAVLFSHLHFATSCNTRTVNLGANLNSFSIYPTNYTYFTLPYPSSSIFDSIIFQFDQVIGQQCTVGFNYTIFVSNGLNGNLCADITNYNLVYSTTNSTFFITFDTPTTTNYSAFSLGITLNSNNNDCTSAKLSLNVDAVCPSPCPGSSMCTNTGCQCFPNYYGSECSVAGACDPFSGAVDPCIVNNGNWVGGGNKTCFLNQYANESFWGECILSECEEGYSLENNVCVQTASSSESADPFIGPRDRRLVLIVAGCLIGGLSFIFIVIPLFIIPLIRDYIEKRKHYQPIK